MKADTPAMTEQPRIKRAVYLLRVSDPKQMHTASNIDPEGNSIPTQRGCCDVKTKQLGAVKVDEYVEPGYSGQFLSKRPIFKRLLKRIIEQRDVDYVVIYMRSRAFRNYIDAAVVKQQLDLLGVKLISAKETFGEGYMGEAMEAITDVFNWVRVRMDGEDIQTKMLNKARNGGTNGRAKIGYLNTTVTIDGHKVNTIGVDEERSPYVVMAFELMATGRYPNAEDLQQKLTDAGLRMPRSGKPISVQTLWNLLRDKYYIGVVTYKDMEYAGHHQPLISEELFNKVQRVLDTHSGSGVRKSAHPHYLRGMIWCPRCKQRYTVQHVKSRHDPEDMYYYFFCGGRRDKTCDQPYIAIEAAEQAVIDYYGIAAVQIPDDFRRRLRAMLDAAVVTNHELTEDVREQLTNRLDKLDTKESYLLDLAAEEGWPKDKLRAKVAAIRDERATIQSQLTQAEKQLDTGRSIFHKALALLDNPQDAYRHGHETVRSILNKTFFTKLYVDAHNARVVGHELREPFHLLNQTHRLYRETPQDGSIHQRCTGLQTPHSATHNQAASGAGGQPERLAHCLALTLESQVSTNAVMVDLLTAYSKRSDLLFDLDRATEQLAEAARDPSPSSRLSVRTTARAARPRSLAARLSEAQVRELVAAFEDGTPRWALAERYSSSVSGIARLLRKYRAQAVPGGNS